MAARQKRPALSRLADKSALARLLARRSAERPPAAEDFAALAARARAFAARPDGPELRILRPDLSGTAPPAAGETIFQTDALPLTAAAHRRLADALRETAKP